MFNALKRQLLKKLNVLLDDTEQELNGHKAQFFILDPPRSAETRRFLKVLAGLAEIETFAHRRYTITIITRYFFENCLTKSGQPLSKVFITRFNVIQ